MSPAEAAKLLEIAADATPEQIESRFHELRTKLEDKIAKAPTPGLKAKYRDSLAELMVAFETLRLSADASALPVLQRQKDEAGTRKADGGAVKPEATSTPAPSARPAPSRKPGNKEFVIVALIAVVLLSVGGWFVIKTRAENAEKTRIAAEAGRKAEAQKALLEQARVQFRTFLAEAKIAWEIAEREERDAERQLTELRSELRGLRDTKPEVAAEINFRVESARVYYGWLRNFLLEHPLKLVRARAEDMQQATSASDLAAVSNELQAATQQLRDALAGSRGGEGSLTISTGLPLVKWELRDSLGRPATSQPMEGPGTVSGLAFSRYELSFDAGPTFGSRQQSIEIKPGARNLLAIEPEYCVSFSNLPADARLVVEGQTASLLPDGTLPVAAGYGPVHVIAYRPGFLPAHDFNNDGTTEMEFRWVKADDPRGMVDAYLAKIAEYDPTTQLNLLITLDQVTAALPELISQKEWSQIVREILPSLNSVDDIRGRVLGYLKVAQLLEFRDGATAAQALEEAAKLSGSLRDEKQASMLDFEPKSVWTLAPKAGLQFFRNLEAAGLRGYQGSKHLLLEGYLYAGAEAEAARIEKEAQDLGRESYAWVQKQHRRATEIIDPLRAALVRADYAAFARVAALGLPADMDQFEVSPIASMLWHAGLFTQAFELWNTVRGGFAPDWPEKGPLQYDRVDSHEKDLNPETAALYQAMNGNKDRALALLQSTPRPDSVWAFSRWALIQQLCDRQAEAAENLDRAESLMRGKSAGSVWDNPDVFLVTRLRNDKAREARLLKAYKSTGKDLLLIKEWLVAGDTQAADDRLTYALNELGGNGYLSYTSHFRDFYSLWLSIKSLRDRDMPIRVHPGANEGLLLAYLTRAAGRPGRADAERFPTPHLRHVAPRITGDNGRPPKFPAALAAQGVKSGSAKVRITIAADGKVRQTETIDATASQFAEELTRALRTWAYAPALELGRPSEGVLEYEHEFTSR